jgi:hypothetical protein
MLGSYYTISRAFWQGESWGKQPDLVAALRARPVDVKQETVARAGACETGTDSLPFARSVHLWYHSPQPRRSNITPSTDKIDLEEEKMGNADQKSPAQLRAERFESLRSQWNQLSGRITLGHLRDTIEDTTGQIEALPHRIAELASRGYHYSQGWEARTAVLAEGWPARQREALNTLQEQAHSLGVLGQEIQRLCSLSALSDTILDQLDNKLDHLQAQTSTAEQNVRGTFDTLTQQLYELDREFEAVEFMLDSLDTASFDLYPDEYGLVASEAVWTNHPDEPEGLLFLTDGRVIFEQREKKAKKKVLFITTESELVQEKLWESPVGNIADLEAEDKKKFLSRKELLHFRFHEYTGGLHGEVELRLKDATNEEWAGLIKRVQRGELDAAPAGAPAEAEPPQPPKEIPTRCPACGGQLPSLVKGMRELVCEYCGTKIRL